MITPVKSSSSYVEQHMKKCGFQNYSDYENWAAKNPNAFWQSLWEEFSIIGDLNDAKPISSTERFYETKFFKGATLNFTENILKNNHYQPDDIAVIFADERGSIHKHTFYHLCKDVEYFATFLKTAGVKPHDCVAGHVPNLYETYVCALASLAIGAVWTACSPDFGIDALKDRFQQIHPKVIISANGYPYSGKNIDLTSKNVEIKKAFTGCEIFIEIETPYINQTSLGFKGFQNAIEIGKNQGEGFIYERFEFDHPAFIVFSSGTTGAPKCIVHRAGGILLEHFKEHRLHCNIQPQDIVFYYTTTSWMMWHWLITQVGNGATIVLYEGAPTHPKPDHLFYLCARLMISLFGTSAKYISLLAKEGFEIVEKYDLHALKIIASTGSPLLPEMFDYIEDKIKKDVDIASISGGTDILGCFFLNSPFKNHKKGELQCRSLGLAVEVYTEDGKPAAISEKGELVCTRPFPSQPLCFYGDDHYTKYQQAYFDHFENIWCHGDFAEKTEGGGYIIHGRSDAILNPGGVRIGTAEIYRHVNDMMNIEDSVVIGAPDNGDVSVVLFVVLSQSCKLDDGFINQIKNTIKSKTTPRHVPKYIYQVKAVPRTKNGKLAEVAVKNLFSKIENKNINALENPESLDEYADIYQHHFCKHEDIT